MARGRARRTGVRCLWDTAGLGTSTRARPTRGTWPGPLALSPVTAVAVTTWRLMPRRFAVSSFALRRPRPAVVRPVGAGPFLDRLVLDDSSDLGRLVGKACLGACNSIESSIISVSFLAAFAAAAALLRFLCAVALACAVQASGSQSWHTRQGLSWVQRGKPSFKRHCWQRRWLSFLRRKWEHSGNFGCDSVDDDLSRDLSAIL